MQVIHNKVIWLQNQALNIYPYGSVVYGTYEEGKSDLDFIVIVPDALKELDLQQWECAQEQYSIYCVSTWQEKLNRHDIDALECYFLPQNMVIKQTHDFCCNITTAQLRHSISQTASNSWVKCKKKLTIEKDYAPRIGKKSLWHSLRILNFGMQLMEYKRIVNYGEYNHRHDEIVNNPRDDWEYYKTKYQPIYNAMKSQFREIHRLYADTPEELQ